MVENWKSILAAAAPDIGFAFGRGDVLVRQSGKGIDWTIGIKVGKRPGLRLLPACGVRESEAEALAWAVWNTLRPAHAPQISNSVIVSVDADRWFQADRYRGPLLNWYEAEQTSIEPVIRTMLHEIWRLGQPVWERFSTPASMHELLLHPRDPFPTWGFSNGIAVAALFMRLAEKVGARREDALLTLQNRWEFVVATSGVRDLTLHTLLTAYDQVRSHP